LSGIKRQGSAVNFRSADLAAFMGGVDLDLRNAKMTEAEGVIDVFAFWGGIDIRVPKDWSIESKVLPLLGGYEENLEQTVREGSPRLVIRGTVVMGGVEVKN
jgi:predicted membrane protein